MQTREKNQDKNQDKNEQMSPHRRLARAERLFDESKPEIDKSICVPYIGYLISVETINKLIEALTQYTKAFDEDNTLLNPVSAHFRRFMALLLIVRKQAMARMFGASNALVFSREIHQIWEKAIKLYPTDDNFREIAGVYLDTPMSAASTDDKIQFYSKALNALNNIHEITEQDKRKIIVYHIKLGELFNSNNRLEESLNHHESALTCINSLDVKLLNELIEEKRLPGIIQQLKQTMAANNQPSFLYRLFGAGITTQHKAVEPSAELSPGKPLHNI